MAYLHRKPGRRFKLFALTLAGTILFAPFAQAYRGGVHSYNRHVNRNVHANRNVHVNRSVNRHADIHRHADVHVDRHYSGRHHDNFWGGFATGVATTLVAGAIVNSLPRNSQPVVVNNTNYYMADGVYYQPSGSNYVVVNPPPGVTVTVLPPGAQRVTVQGQVYFRANGIYYQPAMQNGVTVYTTVVF